MRMRRTAVAALLAAGIVVPTLPTAAVAAAKPASPAAASRALADRPAPKPGKTRKPVRTSFVATGVVTAVDVAAGTVTLRAKGGTRDVRRRTVTVAVPDTARVVVNGKRAAPAVIIAGAKITVNGFRSADVYTAIRVRVSQKVVTPAPVPTPTVDPTPTETPAPDVTPTAGPTPSETPDVTPTADPTPTPDADPTVDPEDEIFDDLSA
jgi:hypothetical protein